jgi:hypothetical protein
MGSTRRPQSGTTRNHNKYAYKSRGYSQPTIERRYPSPHFSTHLVLGVGIGIMVSAWLIVRAFVAISPLTNVYAQYGGPSKLPLLLDATGEELTAGLEAGRFTSADLVQVSLIHTFFRPACRYISDWPANKILGLRCSYSRSQFDVSHGD